MSKNEFNIILRLNREIKQLQHDIYKKVEEYNIQTTNEEINNNIKICNDANTQMQNVLNGTIDQVPSLQYYNPIITKHEYILRNKTYGGTRKRIIRKYKGANLLHYFRTLKARKASEKEYNKTEKFVTKHIENFKKVIKNSTATIKKLEEFKKIHKKYLMKMLQNY